MPVSPRPSPIAHRAGSYAHQLLHSTAPAPEIAARQIGNLQCNVDRLKIVGTLAAMQGTLKKLAGQVSKYVPPFPTFESLVF